MNRVLHDLHTVAVGQPQVHVSLSKAKPPVVPSPSARSPFGHCEPGGPPGRGMVLRIAGRPQHEDGRET